MRLQRLIKTAAAVAFAAATASVAQPLQPLVLDAPLDCRVGESCFIQQYFDRDPGSGAKDYRCGTMTYDGHDGVDFRIPTMARQQRGVNVLAAAPGVVRGMRDGMEDVSVRLNGVESVRGRECGNGVTIAHSDGWETQYCHMARGSVRVKIGESVSAGTVLGRVGMSGEAEFPHVHFAVRHNQQKIDPFAWDSAPGLCGNGGHSLWSAQAAVSLAYHSPDLINAGFAAGAVAMDDVESGRAEGQSVSAGSPMLVAFVRVIGMRTGDIQILTMRGPDGVVIARSEARPLAGNRAQLLYFLGKRRTAIEWPRGSYQAQYEVRRDGATALVKRFELEMR